MTERELVERLRTYSAMGGCYEAEEAMEKAADTITRLLEEVERMRGALRGIIEAYDEWGSLIDGGPLLAAIEKSRAALSSEQEVK